MLSLLVESGPETPTLQRESRAEIYVEQVIDFIEMNFSQKITIEDIAHLIGLNRSYLCSLFKQQMNISIQDYLIRYRMDMAAKMLGSTDLSIGDIARSVGYADPLLFSKMFKKVKGASPKHYRSATALT
ncbi:helix-turn-helix transcriptional regulator [Paenibacillus sp. Y412MC10]|uniref:helix-turn-helix transcriptional regulator n=1 Tax=Geobacillus sp. (strain Y412MC10) TaxID=481743 RepID=UPI0021B1CD4F|nr:AraC family transcriptional regulator [Paenibacillus sp. Y412MC10]